MKIIILCPIGVRTGGPEALHQLGHSLLKQGINVGMWYTFEEDLNFLKSLDPKEHENKVFKLEGRNTVPSEYQKYNVPIIEELVINKEVIFVFPETYLHWIETLHQSISVVWWLSVDNCMKSIGSNSLNLNTVRKQGILHFYQSVYAKNFLNALNISASGMLSDYTTMPQLIKYDINDKNSISINAGNKVIFDIESLAKELAISLDVTINLIRGMSREEVYASLAQSYCYIDLGNFPGKDRMAREAAALKCIPIVLDVAGAKDYNLPPLLKFNLEQLTGLSNTVSSILDNHQVYIDLISNFTDEVFLEEFIFHKEVSSLVSKIIHKS